MAFNLISLIIFSGKHPVSALVEICSKNKWSPPDFEMVFDCGPDHKKNFLMKVRPLLLKKIQHVLGFFFFVDNCTKPVLKFSQSPLI